MKTAIIGVDCATQAKKTGLALGHLRDDQGFVRRVCTGSQDQSPCNIIAEWIEGYDLVLLALDAPLGWPIEMGSRLQGHKAGQFIDLPANQFFRRETDRVVKLIYGKQPLDVGADRIARTALAALTLLHDLGERLNKSIELAWEPPAVPGVFAIEVYPSATLSANNLTSSGYKQADDLSKRRKIISSLAQQIDFQADKWSVENNADCLDAVVCVLAGLDFLNGRVLYPVDVALAKKEGWIWVRRVEHQI